MFSGINLTRKDRRMTNEQLEMIIQSIRHVQFQVLIGGIAIILTILCAVLCLRTDDNQ